MRSRTFERFAWAFLGYLIAVILYGAWVRITHSGAGCGSHWPTCQGAIIPPHPSVETLIEYGHRLTSGLCGVFGLVLVVWAWRLWGAGRVFAGAVATLVFVLFEGAIGAGLVLKELVADNDSAARAVVIALHLSNTLMLTASAALTPWWAAGNPAPRIGGGRSVRAAAVVLGLIVLTAMSGAVTALGDTLFPIQPTLGPGLIDKIADNLSPANHFLVRLRVLHPLIAVAAAVVLVWLLRRALAQAPAGSRRWARAALALVGIEVLAGVVNIALAAPGWLQIVHLLLAQLLWVTTVLASATSLKPAQPS